MTADGRWRVLVTGTTGGIGGAVVRAAKAAGCEVVAFDRADFAQPEQLTVAGIDALVFCTGTCPVRPLAQTTDALLEETFRTNCVNFVALLRRIVTGALMAPQGLRVLAVSSVSATEGWPGGAAYCASKGALSAVCRALDAELKGRGVRVKAIEPRWVRTRMFEETAGRMGVDPALAQDPGELAKEIIDEVLG